MSDQRLDTLDTSLHELSGLKSSPHLDHREIATLQHTAGTSRGAQLSQNGKSPTKETSQLTNHQRAKKIQYLRTQRTSPNQDLSCDQCLRGEEYSIPR